MEKQALLNRFVCDLCAFIERYYSMGVESIKIIEMEDYVKGVIKELTGDDALEILSEDSEITICYGESHWHISFYSESTQYQEIYRDAIQIIFEVLDGKLITYSGWAGERPIGGGSSNCNVEETIKNAINRFKWDKKLTEVVIKIWGSQRIHYEVKAEDV